jgi:hypothetical protein
MAADIEPKGEMKAHAKGYALFVSMMKWGTIISFIVAMFVVFVVIA